MNYEKMTKAQLIEAMEDAAPHDVTISHCTITSESIDADSVEVIRSLAEAIQENAKAISAVAGKLSNNQPILNIGNTKVDRPGSLAIEFGLKYT